MHPLVSAVLVNLPLGLALGAAGGLLGIGGGLIAIPVLGYLYGMDQHLAQGTALVMIAPNVLIGFLRYHQKKPVALRTVALMSACAMASSYFAAKLATGLDAGVLHIAFACFLIILAAYFGFQLRQAAPHRAGRDVHEPPGGIPKPALMLLGAASGAMSGIFTIGGGLVVVPALVSLFGISQTRAQGMALAIVVPGALTALYAYAQAGQVDWAIGAPLALGGIASVSWGVRLAYRLSPLRLRIAFCCVLLATAVLMLSSH